MKVYVINYTWNGYTGTTSVEAKNLESAKKKIGRAFGCKDGAGVCINTVSVIGYF